MLSSPYPGGWYDLTRFIVIELLATGEQSLIGGSALGGGTSHFLVGAMWVA